MIIIAAIIAYLLGSIPSGILVARAFGLGDLRKIGSGNIGATNVLRTGNRTAAALTLLGDALKGAIAVLVARALAGQAGAAVAMLVATLGHCYPVFLQFKGGKAVATMLGVTLAYSLPVGLLACATWGAAAKVSRISSVGALAAAGLTPVWMLFLVQPLGFFASAAIAMLVFWRHRANIARLRDGTEPKIGG